MAVAEANILGNNIGRLFVGPGISLAANSKLFNVGSTAGWIVPSPSTGGAVIAYISVLLTAGSATGASSIAFGLSSGGTEWTGAYMTFAAYNDSPAMFYAVSTPPASRLGVLSLGQAFWVSIQNAFNAGTIATITCYGWTE